MWSRKTPLSITSFDANRVYIGTSGCSYDDWHGRFYPESIRSDRYLAYYARYFQSVEVNRTFYRLPSVEQVEDWAASVPRDFVFSIKASRFITHMKKLSDPEEPLERLFHCLQGLGPSQVGPILFQLPPRWHINPERLESFLTSLPDTYRYVFEFRDPSWVVPEIEALLAQYHCAFCLYDLAEEATPFIRTTDFVYWRLHGTQSLGHGVYSKSRLQQVARQIRAWQSEGIAVFCYFNNDAHGAALENAQTLQNLLEQAVLI